MKRIEVILADITSLKVDAIVNAANTSLLGGGGVDGAIHRAAGPKLLEACKKLNGCATGQSKITEGYNLPARYVIHTVGPIWHGGNEGEAKNLASCYLSALELAEGHHLRTLAFPSISTGAYAYPRSSATQIAYETIKTYIHEHPETFDKIYLVAFDTESYQEMIETIYAETAEAYIHTAESKLKAGDHHTWMYKDPNRLKQNQD